MTQLPNDGPQDVLLFMQFFCPSCRLVMRIDGSMVHCTNQACRLRTALYSYNIRVEVVDPVEVDSLGQDAAVIM